MSNTPAIDVCMSNTPVHVRYTCDAHTLGARDKIVRIRCRALDVTESQRTWRALDVTEDMA